MEYKKVNINSYFINYISEHKSLFLLYFLLLFTYPLQKIVLPKYYGKVISTLNKGNSNNFIDNVKILLFIYVTIQFLFAFLHKVQGMLVPQFSEYSIQHIFSNLLQNKKLNYENLEVGEILAKIIKVPNIIYKYLDLVRVVFFAQIIVFITALWHYKSVSNKIFYTFIFLVFGIVILQYITYHATMDIEIKREKEKDSIYQHFQDLLNNLISVVVCKQESYEKQYLTEKFKPFIQVFNQSLNLNFIYRIIFAIFNVISFILLNYLLYYEYKTKTITKEHFLSSFIVTFSILQLFSEANYSVRSMVDMYSQVKDMENYFNEKSDLDERLNTITEDKSFSNGTISFRNVSYQYEENSDFKGKYSYALKNIDFTISKNENIAIIGQIGSGKSTLVKLLLKFFEPTQGNIFIDNININEISRDELYNHIFYIPQKPKLLDRTLYENLFYGIESNSKDKSQNINKIKTIMTNMNIEENIIQIFMEKMEQPLGNDGIKLSGGQRQMVWIIRAMLRNPSIIIFDEPTSALDKENKSNIIKVIKEIGKNKTILIISHDEIDSSFRKIELKQGVITNQQQQFMGWTF